MLICQVEAIIGPVFSLFGCHKDSEVLQAEWNSHVNDVIIRHMCDMNEHSVEMVEDAKDMRIAIVIKSFP